MAHGVEPLLPFDLAEASYLAPKFDGLMTTEDLIAEWAKMLQKKYSSWAGSQGTMGVSETAGEGNETQDRRLQLRSRISCISPEFEIW